MIKTFLHPIGYAQSKNEYDMYKSLETLGLEKHIAPILYISDKYVIQPFYEQLPLKNNLDSPLKLFNYTSTTLA